MPILSKEDERYGYEPGSFAFWRNLAVYFCVFSVLGHWMEIVYCSFMNVFGIVDAIRLCGTTRCTRFSCTAWASSSARSC